MHSALTSILVLSTGCGRIAFDAVGDAAITVGDVPSDVPLGAFGTPVVLGVLNSSSVDDDATATADGLELYFGSQRGDGNDDLFKSTRVDRTSPWAAPTAVSELNVPSVDDEAPGISGDGLTMWFTSERGGGYDFYVTTRSNRASTWNPPSIVPELSAPANDLDAEPQSLVRIVLARDVGASRDLFEATRASPGTVWATPTPIIELNTPDAEKSPFLLTDLELYFVSDRPGGVGGTDLYRAKRLAIGMPFGPPELVTELNTVSDEDDPWLTPDGRYILFARDVGGDVELHEAAR